MCQTKQSLGAADTWSQVENNGITYGNLEFAYVVLIFFYFLANDSGQAVRSFPSLKVWCLTEWQVYHRGQDFADFLSERSLCEGWRDDLR